VASSQQLGQKLEADYSLSIHNEGVPLLLCPQLIRQRGGGQIDVCVWKKSIEIWEIKKGFENLDFSDSLHLRPHLKPQLKRLKRTGRFLSGIFNSQVELKSNLELD
jgi:hypothetical protein